MLLCKSNTYGLGKTQILSSQPQYMCEIDDFDELSLSYETRFEQRESASRLWRRDGRQLENELVSCARLSKEIE